MPTKYVFIDRDGAINRRVSRPLTTWERFEFLPRALEGLRLLAQSGCVTLVVTEGPGELPAASPATVTISPRMNLEVALAGGFIEQIFYSQERVGPRAVPVNAVFERAAEQLALRPIDTYYISDRRKNLDEAKCKGFRGIEVRRHAFLEARIANPSANWLASSLLEAAEMIVRDRCEDFDPFAAHADSWNQLGKMKGGQNVWNGNIR